MHLSKINIGISNENTKTHIMRSNCEINEVIIDPFGSTKMRFHFPSSFIIDFKKHNDSDNQYVYDITITRKKNYDLSNSCFFPSIGWKNNLAITCRPKKFILDSNFISEYIPENYGTVEISNISQNIRKFKVGIIIPTFGRYEYLQKCFDSLKKCDLQDCIIVIVDESLTKDINEDKIITNKYIKEYDFNIPTIKIYKNIHKNMFDSINIGLDILGNICEYLMNLDSDTIHTTDFISKTINTYLDVKSNANNLVLVSGFNTSKHKILNNDNLTYCIKESIGGCHICFTSEDYWKYIRYTLISYKWDTNINNLFRKLGGIIATTKPSVIEHIGCISSVRDDNIQYDKSIDFENETNIKKIHIISEDFMFENNQTWIIDIFKKEFLEFSSMKFADNPQDADIIWILGNNINKIKKLQNINLDNKSIISTIHHINWKKIEDFTKGFNEIKFITTKFHVICDKVYDDLRKLTDKPIIISNFWINENIFFPMQNKKELREKYGISINSYCVGSFQRDTEGKDKCMKPKLSKGPDIFVNIVDDMNKKYDNLVVILSGRRRNYIINELTKKNIKYIYFNMVSSRQLNELYNCLDIYIVSSRVEGGPRAILECGISNVPIISTNVGISELILDSTSIYDMNNPLTYILAKPNIEHAYIQSTKYSIKNFMDKFREIFT